MVHDLTSLTPPNGQSTGPYPGAQLAISYEESSTASQAPLGYVITQTDPNATYQNLPGHSGSPNGITTSFSYAGNSMAETGSTTITTTTGSSAAVVGQSEDEYQQGVLVAHIDGLNTTHPETTKFQRNSLDLPVIVTDGNGNVTSYAYDGNGNVLTSTDALLNTSTYTYNQFNQLLTAMPPTGSTTPETINTYDSAGNLQTSAQHPSLGSDQTTNYYYVGTPAGFPSSVKDPRGNSTLLTYDTYGDLATSTDPNGDKTTNAYTSIGQLYCSTSPKATGASVVCPASPSTRVANTTSATFDTSDTLVATSTDPNGNTTTYGYDPNGNQTSVLDPLTNSTVTVFDADDRPISVTSGSGSSAQTLTTTAYDVVPAATGNCLSSVSAATDCTVVTQASGTSIASTTSYYDDAFGNQIESVDPGGLVTSSTYDQANNLKTATTGAGTTTYGYFANNWLQSETYSSPGAGYGAITTPTLFTYYNDGRRHTMADSTGTTTYGFDAYGRLQSVTNGASAVTTYGYDLAGNETCLSYPNSGTNTCQNSSTGSGTLGIVGFGYDASNRMTSLVDWNSKTVNFGYDFDSNWNATTYPTTTRATSVAQTFGNADNLTNQTVTNANLSGGSQSTTWTPNADENFASTQANSGTANAYGYTALNQVSSLAGVASDGYDQLGRVTTSNTGSNGYYGYSADSALCWTSATAPGGSTSCSAPPTGSTTYGSNTINDRCYSDTTGHSGSCASPPANTTTTTYGYNQLGELTCLTAAGNATHNCGNQITTKTTTYRYNGDGLRMSDTPANKSLRQIHVGLKRKIADAACRRDRLLHLRAGGRPDRGPRDLDVGCHLPSLRSDRSPVPVQINRSHRRIEFIQRLWPVPQLHCEDGVWFRGWVQGRQRADLSDTSLLRPGHRAVHQRGSAGESDRTAVQLCRRGPGQQLGPFGIDLHEARSEPHLPSGQRLCVWTRGQSEFCELWAELRSHWNLPGAPERQLRGVTNRVRVGLPERRPVRGMYFGDQ